MSVEDTHGILFTRSFLPPCFSWLLQRGLILDSVRNSFAVRMDYASCLIEFPILPSRASFRLCLDGQCHLTTRASSATLRAIFVEFASIRSEPGKS